MQRLVGAAGILTAAALTVAPHGRIGIGAMLLLWLASRGRHALRDEVKRQQEPQR